MQIAKVGIAVLSGMLLVAIISLSSTRQQAYISSAVLQPLAEGQNAGHRNSAGSEEDEAPVGHLTRKSGVIWDDAWTPRLQQQLGIQPSNEPCQTVPYRPYMLKLRKSTLEENRKHAAGFRAWMEATGYVRDSPVIVSLLDTSYKGHLHHWLKMYVQTLQSPLSQLLILALDDEVVETVQKLGLGRQCIKATVGEGDITDYWWRAHRQKNMLVYSVYLAGYSQFQLEQDVFVWGPIRKEFIEGDVCCMNHRCVFPTWGGHTCNLGYWFIRATDAVGKQLMHHLADTALYHTWDQKCVGDRILKWEETRNESHPVFCDSDRPPLNTRYGSSCGANEGTCCDAFTFNKCGHKLAMEALTANSREVVWNHPQSKRQVCHLAGENGWRRLMLMESIGYYNHDVEKSVYERFLSLSGPLPSLPLQIQAYMIVLLAAAEALDRTLIVPPVKSNLTNCGVCSGRYTDTEARCNGKEEVYTSEGKTCLEPLFMTFSTKAFRTGVKRYRMQSILFDDSPMQPVLTKDIHRIRAADLPTSGDISSRLLEVDIALDELKETLFKLKSSFTLSMSQHESSVVPCDARDEKCV